MHLCIHSFIHSFIHLDTSLFRPNLYVRSSAVGRLVSPFVHSDPGTPVCYYLSFVKAIYILPTANTDRDSGGINGIQVKESGIYFVYSNFPFGGEGLGCFYKLRYGDRSQTCYWKRKGENSNDATSQHQPCYLGFLTNMNKDEVLGIDLFVGETCRVSNLEFELLLDTSFLGMIKIG